MTAVLYTSTYVYKMVDTLLLPSKRQIAIFDFNDVIR